MLTSGNGKAAPSDTIKKEKSDISGDVEMKSAQEAKKHGWKDKTTNLVN